VKRVLFLFSSRYAFNIYNKARLPRTRFKEYTSTDELCDQNVLLKARMKPPAITMKVLTGSEKLICLNAPFIGRCKLNLLLNDTKLFILSRISFTIFINTIAASVVQITHNKFNWKAGEKFRGNLENRYPTIANKGYPVGCAIPNVYWTVVNSPESLSIIVGATVVK
jgi:hypothetical protein